MQRSRANARTTSGHRRRWVDHDGFRSVLCAALVAAGLRIAPLEAAGSASHRQAQNGSVRAAAQPSASAELRRSSADAVERVALIGLRLVETPTPEDHTLAAMLLDAASAMSPSDEELARRVAAAWFAAGDGEALIESSKRLIRLDPRDTVAQLRVISAQVERLQTIEERLAVYERFLGPAGDRLDAALRSRLALDAALLTRERGDADRFSDLLSQAIEFDPTNKEAASLALTYFSLQVEDPEARFALLLRLLKADPLDPSVYFTIARDLAAQNITGHAERFHRIGRRIISAAGEDSDRLVVERLVLQWANGGSEAVIREINARLGAVRESAERQYEADIAADVPDNELIPPEAVTLGPVFLRLELHIGNAIGDSEAVRRAIGNATTLGTAYAERLTDPTVRRVEVALQAAIRDAFSTASEARLLELMVGSAEDDLPPEFVRYARTRPEWQTALRLLDAWELFREGDPEAAIAAVGARLSSETGQTLPVITGPVAELLRGYCHEALGERESAIENYQRLVAEDPLGPLGGAARVRWKDLVGDGPPYTETGARLAALSTSIPEWIDEMSEISGNFSRARLEPIGFDTVVDGRRPHPGAGRTMRLALTNLSPEPLALGPGRPLNSSFLVSPSNSGLHTFAGPAQAEVVELDKRLRLMPGETVELAIDANAGYSGIAAIASNDRVTRERWQLVQGFTSNAAGYLVAGPFGVTRDTNSLSLEPSSLASMPPQDLAARLLALQRGVRDDPSDPSDPSDAANPPGPSGTHDDRAFPQIIEASAGMVLRSAAGLPGEPSAQDLAPLVDALSSVIANTDPVRAAFMLATLPATAMSEAMEPFDAAARRRLADAAIRGDAVDRISIMLTLVTRITDPADPVFDSILRSRDDDLTRFAAIYRSRLRSDVAVIARSGPTLRS
ncbi:MAG: hypothetical protein AAF235_08295, partial [Planctomycetota bacterium]